MKLMARIDRPQRTVLGVLALALLAARCGAPPPVTLRGDVADAVAAGIASGNERMGHPALDRVLREHLREEGRRFDYSGLRADPTNLEAYFESVRAVRIAALGREELMALLINAYNAYTIKTVLDTMTPDDPDGVESIRDIPDAFERAAHEIGGYRLSLDNIEHNLLRPVFKDPRIHFALNCASLGCPPLYPEAFTGDRLEAQLEDATTRVLSSPDFVRLEDGRVYVTRLLDWYGDDFVAPDQRGSARTLLLYVRRYAAPEVREWIERVGGEAPVGFLDYDWTLNRAAAEAQEDRRHGVGQRTLASSEYRGRFARWRMTP